MKKILMLAAAMCFMLTGCSKKDIKSVGKLVSYVMENAPRTETQTEPVQTTVVSSETVTAETSCTDGGNPYDRESVRLEITISENLYYYENKLMTFDEVTEKIKASGAGVIVEIVDDNAALKAYKKLTDWLAENKIEYTG